MDARKLGFRVTYVRLDGHEYAVVSFDPQLPARLPGGLTSAERDVVQRMLAGASNAEIARDRGTSVRTVAKQIASVFGKLDVRSRAALARLCASLPPDEPR